MDSGRTYMGPLPAAGKWARLEVPASAIALEGSTVKGMSFSLYGGRATWDAMGGTLPGAGTAQASGHRRPEHLLERLRTRFPEPSPTLSLEQPTAVLSSGFMRTNNSPLGPSPCGALRG